MVVRRIWIFSPLRSRPDAKDHISILSIHCLDSAVIFSCCLPLPFSSTFSFFLLSILHHCAHWRTSQTNNQLRWATSKKEKGNGKKGERRLARCTFWGAHKGLFAGCTQIFGRTDRAKCIPTQRPRYAYISIALASSTHNATMRTHQTRRLDYLIYSIWIMVGESVGAARQSQAIRLSYSILWTEPKI